MESKIRQPIVTVVGHVDHGKTSILDCLRGSSIQEFESGGITQKISFTLYPASQLKLACPLIEESGIKMNIPGFLLIDTPGHAAFTNLRKRGGSLADLAVLVIDINEGIKPQTAEVIKILKHNKTPFIIAINKIDNIGGWRHIKKGLRENISSQQENVKQIFNERYMTLIGSLNSYGFDADLFYNIEDFTKKISLVPVSARTKEGIPELIMMLCGLSQKYLGNKLKFGEEAKGVMLEVKKEKSLNYIEAILYDGNLKDKDEIAISNFDGTAIITRIRVLEEILPLSKKFRPTSNVQASTGIRMQLVEKFEVLPGMPFMKYNKNKSEIEKIFKKEISESISSGLKKQGIIAKADSLGSLEALLVLLKEKNIPVVKTGIGSINKTDLISGKANLDINELNAVIVGFNTDVDEELKNNEIKIITNDVIYRLIEDLVKWRTEKGKEIEKKRLMGLATLCKLKVLDQYVFRNSNPAIFGTRIEVGKLVSNLPLIDDKGEKVARVKNMQADKKSVEEANQGTELAISLPGINFERRIKNIEFLYSDITESQFKIFKKNKDLLSSKEVSLLQEIAEIKRKSKADWGM